MIAIKRPVVRESSLKECGRPIIVELYPSFLTLRLKGLRQRHALAYDVLYWRAQRAEAERVRLEKAQSRRPRK
jgi:hypothetical protein